MPSTWTQNKDKKSKSSEGTMCWLKPLFAAVATKSAHCFWRCICIVVFQSSIFSEGAEKRARCARRGTPRPWSWWKARGFGGTRQLLLLLLVVLLPLMLWCWCEEHVPTWRGAKQCLPPPSIPSRGRSMGMTRSRRTCMRCTTSWDFRDPFWPGALVCVRLRTRVCSAYDVSRPDDSHRLRYWQIIVCVCVCVCVCVFFI